MDNKYPQDCLKKGTGNISQNPNTGHIKATSEGQETPRKKGKVTQLRELLSAKQRTINLSSNWSPVLGKSHVQRNSSSQDQKEGWRLGSWPSTGAMGARFLMWHLHTLSEGKSASRYFHTADTGCDMRTKAWTTGENLSDGSKTFCPIQATQHWPSPLNLLKNLRWLRSGRVTSVTFSFKSHEASVGVH